MQSNFEIICSVNRIISNLSNNYNIIIMRKHQNFEQICIYKKRETIYFNRGCGWVQFAALTKVHQGSINPIIHRGRKATNNGITEISLFVSLSSFQLHYSQGGSNSRYSDLRNLLIPSTVVIFPHILISTKCENRYQNFCGKSEKCETAKLENISHKKRISDKIS